MAAGTILLTNNATTVTGAGTEFKKNLAVNDFIVCVVGGVTYTLGVASIESDTALTLTTAYNGPTTSDVAWSAVANQALVGITAQLAADVAKAIRGLNLDKANWQGFYTGTGNITIRLPDGSEITGPSWPSIVSAIDSKADLNELGSAAMLNVGNVAGTVAAGDDSRLNSVNGKTGGRLAGGIGVSGSGHIDLRQGGAYLSWNEDGGTGAGSIVVNPSAGSGGFWIRLVNNTNTVQFTRFTFEPDGIFRAPSGSTSVNNRVRAFTAVGTGYLEVNVDGGSKGLNFFDSDINLKENIQDVITGTASEIIRKIRPVSYKFKDTTYGDDNENVMAGAVHDFGVIAQELEELLPHGVITMSNGKKSLDPLEIFGLLLASQRETILRLDELENNSNI